MHEEIEDSRAKRPPEVTPYRRVLRLDSLLVDERLRSVTAHPDADLRRLRTAFQDSGRALGGRHPHGMRVAHKQHEGGHPADQASGQKPAHERQRDGRELDDRPERLP
eukprot:10656816-Heterocapsa_arctica.AAC.1